MKAALGRFDRVAVAEAGVRVERDIPIGHSLQRLEAFVADAQTLCAEAGATPS